MTDNPILTPDRQPEDADTALRPKTLSEFVGQATAKDNLRVFIESAKSRRDDWTSNVARFWPAVIASSFRPKSILGPSR